MKPYFAFQWHITDDCDQRCKHCYIFSENNCKKIESMTWQQMQDTFYNCIDFCETYGREPYFYITGGDPILHPYFWKLLALIKKYNIKFTILGNPFHLNPDVCKKLKEHGCQKYQISIDGNRNTHDWFRKKGSFDISIEKIQVLNQAKIRSVVMTTVSKVNVDQILDIIDIVVEAKAKVFAFSRYVPSGGELDTGLSADQYHKLLIACDKKFKYYESLEVDTYFSKKDHLWKLLEYENKEFIIPDIYDKNLIYGGCNCGASHLTILPSGEVYACRRVENSLVGNVLDDRLSDIWITSMEKYREYEKFSKCSKCKLLSWCRGCPAVAKGFYKDFYANDPQCWADENGELFIEDKQYEFSKN